PHQPAPGRIVVAGLLALVVPAVGVWRWLQRRGPATDTPRRSTGVAMAATAVASGLLCVTAHAPLPAGGGMFADMIRGDSPAALLAGAVRVGLLLAASVLAATLVARFVGRPWLWAWAGVIATTYLLVGWRLSLLPDDLHYFGSLSTYAPN